MIAGYHEVPSYIRVPCELCGKVETWLGVFCNECHERIISEIERKNKLLKPNQDWRMPCHCSSHIPA